MLPPAPTIPATDPSAFLLMNGTTEYVAPSDICTNRLKTIIAGIASASTRHLREEATARRLRQTTR